MDPHAVIRDMVSRVAPEATVTAIEEVGRELRITLAGATGAVARCAILLDAVEAAARWGDARRRLAVTLKQCADDALTPAPGVRA